MTAMKSSTIFTLFLSACDVVWSSAISVPSVVTRTAGTSVTVHCGYDRRYADRSKYWCRGKFYSRCRTVVKTTGPRENGRSSISEDKSGHVFSVTVTSLQRQDEGRYWCVISAPLRDINKPVYLQVVQSNEYTTDVSTTTSPQNTFTTRPQERSTTHSEVWATLRWILFLLLLACPLAVCLWKSSAGRSCVTLCLRPCLPTPSPPQAG
ncbi:hypothetical protein AAFF_G00206910 [Aldrovandia affinis]|uniref:Ig-like domain-containing protein n=1 Tax=Aldrovandia affinis TaxID=143900 RepID=A0AAD7RHK4_9TELE|nr:hypothetical protein AAFF_G00206910 [Aldrovandia affinis]